MNFYDFLRALTENNQRDWFEKNKKWYDEARLQAEEILDPVIAALGRQQDLGDLKAKKAMFRIYRDVRFSKDKSPYKINFSAMLVKGGRKDMESMGYYIHFQPGESFLAAGQYEPSAASLARIRQEIDYNAAELKAIIHDKEFVKWFGEMKGRQLKTAPKGYDKEHPEIELLRYCQFYFVTPFTEEDVLSPDFPEKVVKATAVLRPFLEFMARATEVSAG